MFHMSSGIAARSVVDRLDDTNATVLTTCDTLLPTADEARQLAKFSPTGLLVPPSTNSAEHGWQLVSLEHSIAALVAACGGPPPAAKPTGPLVRALWRVAPLPLPVDACFPLFILYTSGSTGKVGG